MHQFAEGRTALHTDAHVFLTDGLTDTVPRRLSATFVRSVKPAERPRTYGDGRGGFGLSLCVIPNGVKYWSQRIRIKDRYTNLGLGGYPLVTLAEARDAALANARAGGDPRKRKPAVPTVAETARAVIERDTPTWHHPDRMLGAWRTTLERHAAPILGIRVDKVTSGQIVDILGPLWNTKRETAIKTKTRLNAVFKLAVAAGHRADNPVDTAGAAPTRNARADRPRFPTPRSRRHSTPSTGRTPGSPRSWRSASSSSLRRAAARCAAPSGTKSTSARRSGRYRAHG